MQTNSSVTRDFRTPGAAASYDLASQILRDQLEVPECSLTFRTGRLERSFEAVADVVVNQCLFGIFNCALHGLQLLGDLSARPALFDHFDNCFEVTVGTFQTPSNRRMWLVRHSNLLSSMEDSNDPPWRIEKGA